MSSDTVITVKNVSKTFRIQEVSKETIREKLLYALRPNPNFKEVKALETVNFEVKQGEFFGIIGRNGSGKSTLLKLIMGAMAPDKGGLIKTKGKMIRLALGMGFDPNLSARENVFVNGSILGLTFKRISLIFDDIIGFAELEEFVDTPVKFYSSGMRARLAFSVAMNAQADIFLMDEFFGGVGDESFKAKSEEVFKNTLKDGRTILHVSHQMPTIRKHCDRALLLNKGKQVGVGRPNDIITQYHGLFPGKLMKQKLELEELQRQKEALQAELNEKQAIVQAPKAQDVTKTNKKRSE